MQTEIPASNRTMHPSCQSLFGSRQVLLRETPKPVTLLDGLVAFIEFLTKLGYAAQAQMLMPFHLSSPNAIDPADTLTAFIFAEVAGCQVEIGAAGAMAAAAVIQAAGGTRRQACDAAAISFQNTMGTVCDLVQGIVEIPCHTRNAAAAAAAFVNADLVLGGYDNPIPLDETIEAVYAVGLVMPAQLRVTSLGGLAATPSAKALPRLEGGCESHL